jgi:hypothetical protein
MYNLAAESIGSAAFCHSSPHLFRFNKKSVVWCRRPITRPVTTERISVRMSSLARARSSQRANRNLRNPAPAAAAAWAEPKTAWHPHRYTKTLFPFSLKKRSFVAAPGRTVFNSPRARHLSPALRSELQTDRHRIWRHSRATQFLWP